MFYGPLSKYKLYAASKYKGREGFFFNQIISLGLERWLNDLELLFLLQSIWVQHQQLEIYNHQ